MRKFTVYWRPGVLSFWYYLFSFPLINTALHILLWGDFFFLQIFMKYSFVKNGGVSSGWHWIWVFYAFFFFFSFPWKAEAERLARQRCCQPGQWNLVCGNENQVGKLLACRPALISLLSTAEALTYWSHMVPLSSVHQGSEESDLGVRAASCDTGKPGCFGDGPETRPCPLPITLTCIEWLEMEGSTKII